MQNKNIIHTNNIADEAKNFIASKGLMQEFPASDIQIKKQALLYAWGAHMSCPDIISKYEH